MVRPRGWPEAVVAVPAAALLIATGVVTWADAVAEIKDLLPVVGFLAAGLGLAKLCDVAGLFHAAGIAIARPRGRRPRKLPRWGVPLRAGTPPALVPPAACGAAPPLALPPP